MSSYAMITGARWRCIAEHRAVRLRLQAHCALEQRTWRTMEVAPSGAPSMCETDRLRPVQVLPAQPVPAKIPKPSWWHGQPVPPLDQLEPEIHDEEGIARMRAAGCLAAAVLEKAGKLARPGVTTEEIDACVHAATVAAGAYPSPLRYGGPPAFPKSVCTSVNECVCHGVPDTRPLRDGDIVNIDVTVWLDGYHGDTSRDLQPSALTTADAKEWLSAAAAIPVLCQAHHVVAEPCKLTHGAAFRTFLVGDVTPEARELVMTTKAALDAGIAVCGPGVDFREIGRAISSHVKGTRFRISEHFIGHGVGRNFHAPPNVLPTRNWNNEGLMQEGQTFTVEPILHNGRTAFKMWDDGWTCVSKDGSWTAQFEHTLLVTEGGVEILTSYE